MRPEHGDLIGDGVPLPVSEEHAPRARRRLADGTRPVVPRELAADPRFAEGTRPVVVDSRLHRSRWPWLAAGIGVAGIGAAGIVASGMLAAEPASRSREDGYPVVATAAERTELAAAADRWTRGKDRIAVELAAFAPTPVTALVGAGRCTLIDAPTATATTVDDHIATTATDADLAITTRLVLLPGEPRSDLAGLAVGEIDALIAAATRGRFHSEAARDHVRALAAGGLTIVLVDELTSPGLAADGRTNVRGVTAGTAYVLDPATGRPGCAGVFRAESTGDDASLEAATVRAITSSLRSID